MENFFIFKGVKINYLSFGSGETTLFLHGWEGSIDSFLFVANEINGHKVLIDLPPFGKSEDLIEVWTLYDYIACVKTLLEILNVNRYNIVAHSFGGRIALILATSTNVNKMVLTGCAGIKDKSLKLKYKVFKYKIKKRLHKFNLISNKRMENAGSSDYIKLDNTMKQTFNNIINLDLRKTLKYVDCEVLLIWGAKDNATPLKDAKLMNKKLKNSGLYVFDNGSHFAYIEYGKSFVDAVKLFLKV